jgi:hypothetical protein
LEKSLNGQDRWSVIFIIRSSVWISKVLILMNIGVRAGKVK